MKVLIVFYALAILNTMFFVYQSDMNSFIRESEYIKSVADECASGASSLYDEEALSEGYYAFDEEECGKYIQYIIEHSFNNPDDITFDIISNDAPGTECPSIEVVLHVGGDDRFRLPFITVNEIKRAGYYEISGY